MLGISNLMKPGALNEVLQFFIPMVMQNGNEVFELFGHSMQVHCFSPFPVDKMIEGRAMSFDSCLI